MAVVSAVEEVLVGVEGYDDDVEGLQVKEDMEVFGRGVRAFHVILIRRLEQ